jgi:two-component system, cell cycle sensor histidine kinase and response regulator CckA
MNTIYAHVEEGAGEMNRVNKQWNNLHAILEATPDAITITNLNGTITDCSAATLLLHGYSSKDELIGKSSFDLIATEDHAKAMEAIKETLAKGSVREREYVFLRKDGTAFSAELSAAVVGGEGGEPAGFIGITKDITERRLRERALREAEEALKESEHKYRTLFSHASEGIFIMSMDGKSLVFNESFAKMHGYSSPEEMEHLKLSDLDTPETAKLAQERLSRLAAGESMNFEVEHFHKDGHTFPLSVSCNMVEIGGISHFMGFHRDITELKRVEASLRKSEEQLLQSQKMEAIGQLSGGIAHDFNNIIATISGTAEILLKTTPSDAPMVKKLERILNSTRRAKDLTMKLLTFARKEKLNVKIIHPKDIVSDLIDMLKGTMSTVIDITSECEDGIKWINVDSNQIFQAILNICLNGCDAMPQGGNLNLKISRSPIDDVVASERGVKSGEFVVISVEDTGTGIDADKVSNIFEPFFTTKDRGKGSGLGLSVSHGIIKAHGGFIEVKTEKRKGTTFSVFLPATDSAVLTTDKEEEKRIAKTAKGNILIIDDDQEFVQVLKESLEIEGFVITAALSGKEAINYYKDKISGTDVILLDMLLPEMNGKDIFFTLKELNPAVKIVLCSGYSIEGEASTLLQNGALAFLQKPFEISEAMDVISRLIE